jgi:endonuclease YncB( thermonuclease family)
MLEVAVGVSRPETSSKHHRRRSLWCGAILFGFTLGVCSAMIFGYLLLRRMNLIPSRDLESTNRVVSISTQISTPTNVPTLRSTDLADIGITSEAKTPTPEEMRELALVTRVIDGDTIEVELHGEIYQVRYIGVDSPEGGQAFSQEATQANRQLVEGQTVELVKDVSETDPYARLLRYVYLEDGTLVNAALVRKGYARASAYPPDTRFQSLLERNQQVAQSESLGMWVQPTPTNTALPSDVASQVEFDPACSQFNAPGDDNQNRNEEYLCFHNPGSLSFDLTGWTIEDDYGWTYTFPKFILEAGTNVKVRTGCGTDTAQDLFWCKDETAIWNNSGDCVHLLDTQGELVIEYCY